MKQESNKLKGKGGADFLTTRWSVVVSAGEAQSDSAGAALESLCRAYWMPLYCFVRRQGHSPQEAEDFTQGFFERVIEKGTLANVDRSKGKFRSYLLACLKHFMFDEYKRSRRLKRGGESNVLSLDSDVAEKEFAACDATNWAPDLVFDRRWATTLLRAALSNLEEEMNRSGKARNFRYLKPFLVGEVSSKDAEAVGKTLGMSRNHLQVTTHRLRQRYREFIRREVAGTVASPSEIDDEMRYLSEVLTLGG